MKKILVLVLGLSMAALYVVNSYSATEKDPIAPRVPADQIAAAKAMKNPVASNPANIAKGKDLFTGKATCFTCHGETGDGNGPAGAALDPLPRNFKNAKFQASKTDGELFWVIKNGSAGTGMISYVPSVITEQEAWEIITFERSIK
ncbi:MAG TPA: c-type cytochrome [Nitrospiria bacterium]|nr:c-type cytochrome [Nitrospiria bacterium]